MSAFSQILDIASDLAPDVRSPLVACAVALLVLIVGLTWFGWNASSPARAAEAAVRVRLGDPSLTFTKSRIYHNLPPGLTRHRHRLVCGQVKAGPAFAALVWERRGRSAERVFGVGGDRVERIAVGDQGDPALLAACMTR